MIGKRKFTLGLTFLVLIVATVWVAMFTGLKLSGDNLAVIIMSISAGTAFIAGTMSLENISQVGGFKAFLKGKPEEKSS